MKKSFLRISTLVLLLALIVGLMLPVSAEDELLSGMWGELSWTLNETTGELVISGNGPMADFESNTSLNAWRGDGSTSSGGLDFGEDLDIGWGPIHPASAFSTRSVEPASRLTKIKSVVICEGVTSIGNNAFFNCKNLTEITIPSSVTAIGTTALYKCTALSEILYAGTPTEWTAVEKGENWDYLAGSYSVSYGKQAFSTSMQAFLNLESEVTMSVGYKLEGMESLNADDYLDRLGLLIWDASVAPDEANATYSNCDDIIEGAVYNAVLERFESTTNGIAAKNLGDQLTFRAYCRNSDGSYSYSRLITNYSPKTYCYNQIKNNPDDERLINLMASILNYGAAAQIHFDYRTEDLMNASLTEEQKTLVWDGTLVRSDYAVPNDKDAALPRADAVSSRGGYLDLEGAIDYNFYAKVDFEAVKATVYYWTEEEVANLDALTLENASSCETMTRNAELNRWEGKYEGQAAKEMFHTVYACMVFEDSEGQVAYSGVVGYSPERYAYLNQDKGNTNAELAKRLAVYGDAARAFFADN